LFKGLNRSHQKAGDINVPEFNTAGEYQSCQDDIQDRIGNLRDIELYLATVAVGKNTGYDSEEKLGGTPDRKRRKSLIARD
jgi:hypothetical protein